MRLLYVMDPLETMHPEKDTTFAFMRAAQRAGHANYHALLHHLRVDRGRLFVRASSATVSPEPPFARYGEAGDFEIEQFDAVLIRKDPPFDQAYLYTTLLLECARASTLIVNDPRALRDANEKLHTLLFPEWTPRTMVTADRSRIFEFVEECGGTAVIKPLDGAGGRGVLRLTEGDLNARSIVDLHTEEGTRLAMVQEYLPASREGDKRVLLLDGAPLGAILRVPRSDDLRANIHVGGTVQACTLTDHEKALVASVGPRLKAIGLYFVGLDLIGERLTEVNVTSPTGIQELGRLTGTSPEDQVIRWIEESRI